MNVIFGSAGFAKEVDWLIYEIYHSGGEDFRPSYFITEDDSKIIGEVVNGATIIAESEFFSKADKNIRYNCFIAVGSPIIKEKIVNKIKAYVSNSCFPNIIHPDVTYDKRPNKLTFGEGNIICSNSVLTTDIVLGNFIHLNLDCTVGHDSRLGDYSTISPGVHISGNTSLGNKVFIGTGANILEKLDICSDTVIGAGSTVVKSITEPGTYVGIPAKKIK